MRCSSLLSVTVRGSTRPQADEKRCCYHFPRPLHMQPSVPSLGNVTSPRKQTVPVRPRPSLSSNPLQTNLRHQLGFKELQAVESLAGPADKQTPWHWLWIEGALSPRPALGRNASRGKAFDIANAVIHRENYGVKFLKL